MCLIVLVGTVSLLCSSFTAIAVSHMVVRSLLPVGLENTAHRQRGFEGMERNVVVVVRVLLWICVCVELKIESDVRAVVCCS